MRFVVLCALVAVALATSQRRQLWDSSESGSRSEYVSMWRSALKNTEQFRAGNEYTFQFDTQIASGIGSLENVEQKATHRLQTLVKLHFETERSAVLRFTQIRVGALNAEIEEPRRVLPMKFFEEQSVEEEIMEQLKLPVKFDYVDGLVERLFFHPRDSAWSKNTKRACLNMIQLNLKRKNNLKGIEWEQQGFGGLIDEETANKIGETRMFTLPETTLEGECQTVYTINKVQSTQSEMQVFNVTKSIDFKQCKKIVSLRYGPRSEKPCIECKQQWIDEQKLDRTTVLRFQLVSSSSQFQEKYAIAGVELLSQYVYKSLKAESEQPMQTIVAGRLVFQSVEKRNPSKKELSELQTKEETLLYTLEWHEKERRFFQYGDDEFSQNESPYATVHNKAQTIIAQLRKVAQALGEKNAGIEAEIPLKLQNIVEIVRMCNTQELKQVRQQIEEQREEERMPKKMHELFTDILSIAATRNTINLLVEEIMKKQIDEPKAVQAMQQLSGVPVVSDKQIDIVLRLCKSEIAQRSAPLRQSCFLTAGAMIGELCKETVYDNVKEFETQCPRHKKEKYQKTLVDEFKNAETTYQKVLALKTIGNAAIDLTVFDLEKIIVSKTESTIVRQQAIDSLRRLRNQMPRKIQRILMPVFKNMQEQPEVRMTAFAMIMHTVPDKSILDQISFVLFNERSQHVKSFVYSTMKTLADSPVPVEQKMGAHLKTICQMANIEEDTMRASRFMRVPIYSQQYQEGLFVNLATLFSTNNMLPKHVTFQVDSFLNGLFEKNSFEVSVTQDDIERYFEKLFQTIYGSSVSLRGRRDQYNGEQELESIFDDLKLKNRRGEIREPFGMLNLRIRDIDQAMLPLSDNTMPRFLKKLLNGERESISELDWLKSILTDGKHFRTASAMYLHERSIKVATSCGMPLRMWNTMPVVASVEGRVQMKSRTAFQGKIHPIITAVHVQKMEIWCPLIKTGVESVHSFEMNLPVEIELDLHEKDENEKVKIIFKLPQQKTRVLGFHSLPMTYTCEFDQKTKLHREPKVKTIKNNRLESRVQEINQETTSFKVSGLIHRPWRYNYQSLLEILTATENHLHIEFLPTPETPRQIEIVFGGKLFRKSSVRPEFSSFYGSNKKFENVFTDDVHSDYSEEMESESERRNKLSKFSTEYEPKQMYKHQLRAEIRTVGGRRQHKAQIELEASCDSKMHFCKLNTEILRTPVLSHETNDWKLSSEMQLLMPEYVRSVEELRELTGKQSPKQNKLVCTISAQWGPKDSSKLQQLNLKIQGERSVPMRMLKTQGKDQEWRRLLATAFLNKYDLVADFKLSETSKRVLSRGFEVAKIWQFWSIESSELLEGREGHVYATVIIDPRTRQHMNVSIKTPSERVRFQNVILPMSIKPFPLLRQQHEMPLSLDSVSDVFSTFEDIHRAECRVDGRRVSTFDNVLYKAPLGQCYSVIAKDCARKQFVVLMKSLDSQDSRADKKIKVITKQGPTIEVQPEQAGKGGLVVKIDGERITTTNLNEKIEERLAEHGIECVNGHEDIISINLRREQVSIRFDGQQATVKMSKMYKQQQCGLCGHFDDETEDEYEFRMNNDEPTSDIKSFHRSYSIIKDDNECKPSTFEKLYEQDSLFENEYRSSRNSKSPKNTYSSEWSEWTSTDSDEGFESDEQVDDYEYFGRNKYDSKKGNKYNDYSSESNEEDKNAQEPVEKTKVIEYNHKICFSMKPVKQCRKGSYPEKTEEVKVKFTCLNRTSPEARRLMREAKNNDISDKLSEYQVSFVENVRYPRECSTF